MFPAAVAFYQLVHFLDVYVQVRRVEEVYNRQHEISVVMPDQFLQRRYCANRAVVRWLSWVSFLVCHFVQRLIPND